MSTSPNDFDFFQGKKSLADLTGSTRVCSLPVAKRICREAKLDYISHATEGDKRDYLVDYDEFRKAWLKHAKAKRKKAQETTAQNGAKRKAINKLVKAGASYEDAKAQVSARAGAASPKA